MAVFDSCASLKNWKETGLSFPSIARVIHPCVDDTFMEKAAQSTLCLPQNRHRQETLQMLWDEYIERCPDGYRYSRFCDLYRIWASRLSVTMRQTHSGGDKLFVDYAGDTVPVIIDRVNGKTRPAQIFVGVLGASNFTYAEASWTQGLGDWIAAHTRAFAAIGGVPRLLVPDNTKVAVIKACLYEPQVNRTGSAEEELNAEGNDSAAYQAAWDPE